MTKVAELLIEGAHRISTRKLRLHLQQNEERLLLLEMMIARSKTAVRFVISGIVTFVENASSIWTDIDRAYGSYGVMANTLSRNGRSHWIPPHVHSIWISLFLSRKNLQTKHSICLVCSSSSSRRLCNWDVSAKWCFSHRPLRKKKTLECADIARWSWALEMS